MRQFAIFARTLILGLAVLVGYAVPASASNLLFNTGFETPESGVTPPASVSFTNYCFAGNSAAADWTIFVNSCSPGFDDLSTQLLASTLSGGGNYMMHVVTDGGSNGIVQTFLAGGTGPAEAIGSAWVYLNSGCVLIGTGNGGDTGADATTCTTDQWIQLSALNGVSPANEFIVYSYNGGADFYVDNASVTATPEPASLLLLGSGIFALYGFLRRS